jgi:thiamine biosynthesis lipoprotein
MSRPRARLAALLPAALFAGALLLPACERSPQEVVLTGPTMGTTWTLRVVPGEAQADPEALRRLVQEALDEVDAAMSTYRPDSAVSRFNASTSTDWIGVPASLAALVGEALEIGLLTGGAFDITVSPVVALWGFGSAAPRATPPTDREIAAAQATTGQRHLAARADPPALRKSVPGLTLDLDSIAPGYAVDLVADRLEAAGQTRYMIEIGGELRVLGRNAQGQRWRIGIERPEASERAVALVLNVAEGAVSTSGDYRDYFESAGVRYSHTLDPRSGRPVAHGLASVTVLRPTAAEADGLATALTVLGPSEGFELAERMGWAALFIERTTEGFRHRETGAFKRAADTGESGP